MYDRLAKLERVFVAVVKREVGERRQRSKSERAHYDAVCVSVLDRAVDNRAHRPRAERKQNRAQHNMKHQKITDARVRVGVFKNPLQ